MHGPNYIIIEKEESQCVDTIRKKAISGSAWLRLVGHNRLTVKYLRKQNQILGSLIAPPVSRKIGNAVNKEFLDTHHVRGRGYNSPEDLRALCVRCHSDQKQPVDHSFMKDSRRYRRFIKWRN